MTRKQLVIILCGIFVAWAVTLVVLIFTDDAQPRIVLGPAVIENTIITESEDDVSIEEFVCEFNPPLKYINIVSHYYDSYAMLNEEYRELQDDDTKEIWGWSRCLWQPEDNWAMCDMYLKVPDTVEDADADYAIETSGHEYWHAACGDFHK